MVSCFRLDIPVSPPAPLHTPAVLTRVAPPPPTVVQTVDPREMFSRKGASAQNHSDIGDLQRSSFRAVLSPHPDICSPQSRAEEEEGVEDQEGNSGARECAAISSLGTLPASNNLNGLTASPLSTAVQSPATENIYPVSLGIVPSIERMGKAASPLHVCPRLSPKTDGQLAENRGSRRETPCVSAINPPPSSSTTCHFPGLSPGKTPKKSATIKREAIRRLAEYSSDSEGSSSPYIPAHRVTRRAGRMSHIIPRSSSPHPSPVISPGPVSGGSPDDAGTSDSESDYAPPARPASLSRTTNSIRVKEAKARHSRPKGRVKRGGPVRQSQNRKAQSVYREKKKALASLVSSWNPFRRVD